MKCPTCGCRRFYVKDPADEYETYVFEHVNGGICFPEGVDPPPITGDTGVYCDQCAWNGAMDDIKPKKEGEREEK